MRLDKCVDKWAGSLEIGVTTHAPTDLEYPSTMTNVRQVVCECVLVQIKIFHRTGDRLGSLFCFCLQGIFVPLLLILFDCGWIFFVKYGNEL